MFLGNDLSDNQGEINWSVYKDNTNFVFMKASEGNGYIDKWFGNNRTQARKYNIPRGFYHFARPDLGNTAADEAKFFIHLLQGDPLQEGEILALDFEVPYSGNIVGWCKAFLDIVSQEFNGIKPLIYLNQSQATSLDWTPVIAGNYGLWIAAYTYDPTNNNFQIGKFPSAAIQQWSDKQQVPGIPNACDGDVFFGDANAFKAYGYKPTTPPTPPTPTPGDPCADINAKYQQLLKDYYTYKESHPVQFTAAPVELGSASGTSGGKTAGAQPAGVKQAIITLLKYLNIGTG